MKNKFVCNSIGTTSVCGECIFGRPQDENINDPCKVNRAAVLIPMHRYVEIRCANTLKKCSFLPGSFDKTFVKRINIEPNYVMSDNGRNLMFKLLHKYRRQIVNYQKIRKLCIDNFDVDPEKMI